MTWVRYSTPQSICSCGCSLEAHDIGTKAQACSVCACKRFDLTVLRWTERRTVDEAV